ncbi:Beta N-acetyl-glucosaminidase [Pacificimonas flava]|uniref:beta-N-acetylhexosaminidase n=2 Tax=Pacificimonas flava TaxID=1234595 RepID=M2TMR2_9SPHN|nr:Beta N-acetyl-glucosaminidase [Pacificimonas flava]
MNNASFCDVGKGAQRPLGPLMLPLFLGFEGPQLTADERALFREADPAGFILFARNVDTLPQLRALTDDLRMLSGRETLPILVDQEGGRVQRLGPPHWPAHPPGAPFAALYGASPLAGIEAARLHGIAIGMELAEAGISVDCLPLLDVPVAGAHDIIGDRALGTDPNGVAALGDAVLRGLRQAGICGIVKHIPGHGRAAADSHESLPVVDASRADLEQDFAPFRALASAPMAMTAHVRYDAVDPARCASTSPVVVQDVIRRDIGFGGLLMCDDLHMSALEGSLADRLEGALMAGCDIALHCTGRFDENRALCAVAPAITSEAEDRLAAAMAWPDSPSRPEADAAARRDDLLGTVSAVS